MEKIKILPLPHATDLPLPAYATAGSAGLDLMAAIVVPIVLKSGEHSLIPTGFSICLRDGFEAQIRSRSGLSLKHGIAVLNSPGTIDSDYRGEIKVILRNFGSQDFTIERGIRIAQMVVAPYTKVVWDVQLDDLSDELSAEPSNRGSGGFGSTGLS